MAALLDLDEYAGKILPPALQVRFMAKGVRQGTGKATLALVGLGAEAARAISGDSLFEGRAHSQPPCPATNAPTPLSNQRKHRRCLLRR
jgi:hypothetical protein